MTQQLVDSVVGHDVSSISSEQSSMWMTRTATDVTANGDDDKCCNGDDHVQFLFVEECSVNPMRDG